MSKLTSKDVEILVSAYQHGEDSAANQILDSYKAYFQKYINLIKYGQYKLSDEKVTLRFIRCFMSSDERECLPNLKKSVYAQRVVHRKLAWLRNTLSFLDEDELLQELRLQLFTMADRHDKDAFVTYVSAYFPLNLAGTLINLIKERQQDEYYTIPLDENEILISSMDEYDLESKQEFYIVAPRPTMYDENWINGSGCCAPFNELNPHERRILKMYYEWKTISLRDKTHPKQYHELSPAVRKEYQKVLKMTEQEIADELGCSRKTVNTKRNYIKEKMRDSATYLRLIIE